jgi:hypothetical protein
VVRPDKQPPGTPAAALTTSQHAAAPNLAVLWYCFGGARPLESLVKLFYNCRPLQGPLLDIFRSVLLPSYQPGAC